MSSTPKFVSEDLEFFARASEPDHIDPDHLWDFLADTLSPAESRRVLHHLATCCFCVELLNELDPLIVPAPKTATEGKRLLDLAKGVGGALSTAFAASRLSPVSPSLPQPTFAGQNDHSRDDHSLEDASGTHQDSHTADSPAHGPGSEPLTETTHHDTPYHHGYSESTHDPVAHDEEYHSTDHHDFENQQDHPDMHADFDHDDLHG
jgi:hypothetical protein